jgi:choline-sulfatase
MIGGCQILGARLPITLGAALLLAACSAEVEPPAANLPDVLLVTVDTLRSDHCSAYGYPLETTPGLVALAADGVLFETTYAAVGATCPSHAALFTAKYPISNGVVRNGLQLVDEERTLTEILKDAGYTTGGFVSSFPVTERFGFAQGFDRFDETFDEEASKIGLGHWTKEDVEGGFDRPATVTTGTARDWLESLPASQPVFLWVHVFDPHFPYHRRPRFRQRFPDKPTNVEEDRIMDYDSEVAFADHAVSELITRFRARAAGRGALVVMTADHGEGLNDHGIPGHNATVYEEEVRVPLVFSWEGRLPTGLRLPQPAHLVDVTPTIVGLLGLGDTPGASEFQGEDLSPYMLGQRQSDLDRPVFFQRPTYPRQRKRFEQAGPGYGVRIGRWKYVEPTGDEPRELFDVVADPDERDNRVDVEVERAASMAAVLHAWLADQQAHDPGRNLTENPEDLEGLRALGYVDEGSEVGDEPPAEDP